MSDMERLHQGVAIAAQAAHEARGQTGNAGELAERIAQAGMHTGFGNDPTLIFQAGERLQTALGGLASAITALDEAVSLVIQARAN